MPSLAMLLAQAHLDRVPDQERLRLRARPRDVPLMRQRWERLAFLHWAVPPRALGGLIPPCLQIDTWDGAAFVGLVPFTVRGVRPPLLPPVPGLSSFHELNFRTYVHRGGRDPGVWFFSLDAGSHLAVSLARLVYKLPYFHARLSMVEGAGGALRFESRRTGARPTQFGCAYETAGPAQVATPGTLPFFLVERYLLYSWDDRRLRSARVWHKPYALEAATLTDLDEDLTTRAGLALERQEPLLHACRGLDVRVYPPHLVAEPHREWKALPAPLGT